MMSPMSHQAGEGARTSPCAPGRDEERGDPLLLGEGAEDMFFNHLDEADFSALAAACSPNATPTQAAAASWAPSTGIPCEPTTASSLMASAGTIVATAFDSTRTPDAFSPTSPSACPTRPYYVQHRFPHGKRPSGMSGLASPTTVETKHSHYQAQVPGFHARTEAFHSRGENQYSTAGRGSQRPTVCLLVVGTEHGNVADNAMYATRGGGLADVVTMLTRELDGHDRTPEIDHVVSGERAVLRVKALARHGLWYRMVVLEVQGSLAGAIATARDLRAANATAPIIAVASPHVLQAVDASSGGRGCAVRGPGFSPRGRDQLRTELLRYFDEFLTMPVPSATIRSLATRWLLDPPEHAAAVASAGMTAAGTVKATCANQARHSELTQASRQANLGPFRAPPHPSQVPLTTAWNSPAGSSSPPLSYPGTWTSASPLASRHGRSCEDPRGADDGSFDSRVSAPLRYPEPLASLKERVFGGGAEDRASPCRLFSCDFARENAEAQEREFDFVFRHGTVVLRVEEDEFGSINPVVCSACEYATTHFGDLNGKPLQSMFEGVATNKNTAGKILRHIEEGDTDSMCSYINLKSEARWEMASFVSVRSLSRRPKRDPGSQRLPPWYVLLKVCLPSTLGLIKEPELLDKMYSRTAMAFTSTGSKRAGGSRSKAATKGKSKPASKRGSKKAKPSSVDESHVDGPDGANDRF